MNRKIRLLVIGASGMLGHTVLRWFAKNQTYEVFGSVRSIDSKRAIQDKAPTAKILVDINVESLDGLTRMFALVQPDVVINCVGIVKQLSESDDPLLAIPINSLLPHRLARLSEVARARLIHVSTDCVFSGAKGMYVEGDAPDAGDLYGRSKFLGEVDYPNAVTLRTSIIGHELSGNRSLIDWFLSQANEVKGYRKAIFSGLPTVEIARIIHEYVIENHDLKGLYHLSAEPINKFDLLSMVAKVYGKNVTILPNDDMIINRSLNSDKFRSITGFSPRPWIDLVQCMHDFR